MPSPSMKRVSTDQIILEDKDGNRSNVIQAVVEDKIHIGSDIKLPISIGNKIIHLRTDDTKIKYTILDYEVHSIRKELYYVISVSKDALTSEETNTSESLRRQLLQHQSNLNKLKEQTAIYALGETPLRLINQIEHEDNQIAKLEDQLISLLAKNHDEADDNEAPRIEDKLSKEQKELLIAAAKRGEFQLLYTEETSTWVRVGGKNFHDDDDPAVAATFLEAFRELCRYGYIVKESGTYTLTGSGFKIARRLASER